MNRKTAGPNPIAGLALRLCLYAAWLGFLLVALFFTAIFYVFQGFSPDGPPPGWKPEPFGWFVAKCLPLVFLGLVIKYWWFSGLMLLATIWEFRRHFAARRMRVPDYDLDPSAGIGD